MLKKIVLIIVLLTILLIPNIAISDDDKNPSIKAEDYLNDQLEKLDLNNLENIIRDINISNKEYLPELNIKKIINSLVSGENFLEGDMLLKAIFKSLFYDVLANSELLIQILILSIICAILNNLQNAFENNTISNLAHYICYIIIISIVIKSFSMAMEIGIVAIDKMVNFMQALLPVLITLLVLMGGITSSALLHPIIVTSVSVISNIMKDVVFPMIFFSAVIGIINNITKKVQIGKLSSLMKQTSIVIIGISTTVFLGIMSVQGAAASKLDGVSIRTAKFAVDNFIPIVGKFLSDSMDTVIGYSMVLKNAIGVVGLIVLFVICLIPVIKIISLIFIYKLTAALVQPISDERITNCLGEISKSLTLILATVLSVVLMFFITINIIVGAGVATIMLR